MIQSVFAEQGRKEIKERIERLTPQSQGLWGKMNVAQMLTHCQKPLEAAMNVDLIKMNGMMKLMSALFGKRIKNGLLYKEIKKGSPTAPGFVINDERDFEKEKKLLIEDIEAFAKKGNAGNLGDRHPLFGKMTHEEWDLLQWRHLDHHLKQFGA